MTYKGIVVYGNKQERTITISGVCIDEAEKMLKSLPYRFKSVVCIYGTENE